MIIDEAFVGGFYNKTFIGLNKGILKEILEFEIYQKISL